MNQKYFDSYPDNHEGRLHLERRDRQFAGQEIAAIRIYSVHNAAKAVCAMHLQRPDLAQRYPKQMYDDFGEKIFADVTKEIVFYSAALALYRIHLLFSNGTVPPNTKRYKWHMLPLLRAIITGEKAVLPLESNKLEKQCQAVVDKLIHHSEEATQIVKRAVAAIAKLEPLNRDRLKVQSVLQDMLAAL